MKNIIVYTANIGSYDHDRNDILCFKEYNKFFHPRLNAKIYKVLYHQFVQSEWSIWIDSNVFLKKPPEYLIELAENSDICVFKHPKRNCIYKEAQVCRKIKLDYQNIIDNQIQKYIKNNYPKDNGLAECSIIIRRNTKEIRHLCNNWWSEICAGSWRDQISFPVVFQNANIKFLDSNLKQDIFEQKKHLKSREVID